MSDEEESSLPTTRKECFTPMQSRRLWAPSLVACRLCPSMDLMVLGLASKQPPPQQQQRDGSASTTLPETTTPTTSSLSLHRTLSGQKIATLHATTLTDETTATATTTHTDVVATTPTASFISHAAWRPDGRLLACAETTNGAVATAAPTITLHHVEALLSNSHDYNAMMASSSSSSTASGHDPVRMACISVAAPQDEQHALSSVSSSSFTAIHGLAWAHIGRPHPLWTLTDDERQVQVSWNEYQSHFCDRQALYLPPSQYHPTPPTGSNRNNTMEEEEEDPSGAPAWPTGQTPLSLLCVATTTTTTTRLDQSNNMTTSRRRHLHVYLHGCYPIFRGIPLEVDDDNDDDQDVVDSSLGLLLPPNNDNIITMVASCDLSHLLVRAAPATLVLFSIPALVQHRYPLQIWNALYSAATNHLRVLQQKVTEIAAAWKSSIKPLDLKLDALMKLLSNYGLIIADNNHTDQSSSSSIRRLLVQYILSGHTRTAPNLSNAMDQFFTGVQMNDQLIQRMEASLTVAVANVEVQVRQYILSPALALLYQVSSSSHLHNNNNNNTTASLDPEDSLVSTIDMQRWQVHCELLAQTAQAALMSLVQARFRLRDFVAWLRSVSAQIKARGTTPKSARRENAKKRRVPDRVVQRMLWYLQSSTTTTTTSTGATTTNTTGSPSVTEEILDLKFGQFLQPNVECVEQQMSSSFSPMTTTTRTTTTPALPLVARHTQRAADVVFAGPPRYFQSRVQATRLDVPIPPPPPNNNNNHTNGVVVVMALTTRLGCGDMDVRRVPYGEPKPDGFFSPTTTLNPSCNSRHPNARHFRQWSLVAQAVGNRNEDGRMVHDSTAVVATTKAIRLYALPLHWSPGTVDPDGGGLGANYAWTVDLVLPSSSCPNITPDEPPFSYQVVDMAFYQDDGKSSLSSGRDSGTGKEGKRQALVVLAKRQPSAVVELWLVPYEDLVFDVLPLLEKKDKSDDDTSGTAPKRFSLPEQAPNQSVVLEFASHDNDPRPANERAVYVRTRTLSALEDARLELSGPRGMAAIFGRQYGGTLLELYDLEEDEEEEEAADDDDDAMDEQ